MMNTECWVCDDKATVRYYGCCEYTLGVPMCEYCATGDMGRLNATCDTGEWYPI